MNKFSLLMMLVFFLVFSTFVAGSLTGFGVTENLQEGVTAFEFSAAGISTAIGFFFKLLAFQVTGIPAVINILVFWPLTIGILYMIIEMNNLTAVLILVAITTVISIISGWFGG